MKKNLFKVLVALLVFISVDSLAQNKKSKSVNYNEISKAGSFKEYISKDNALITVGDTLQVGVPSNTDRFVYITQNDGYLRADKTDKKLILKAINVSGDDKSGYEVFFTLKGLGATPVFVKYEDALLSNEIKLITKDSLQ